MSEMIERVAEALFNCEPMHEKVKWADLFRVERQPTSLIESYRRRARIAIEATEPFIQERIDEAVAEASSVAAYNQAVSDAYH